MRLSMKNHESVLSVSETKVFTCLHARTHAHITHMHASLTRYAEKNLFLNYKHLSYSVTLVQKEKYYIR